jgi:hypothetical protein
LYQFHILYLVNGCLRQDIFSWRNANRGQFQKPLQTKHFFHAAGWRLASHWKHLAQTVCQRRRFCAKVTLKTKSPKPAGLGLLMKS